MVDAASDDHEFGGPWTELKLDAISDYLAFFCNALQYKPNPARPFVRWYVDAFAGSGQRTSEQLTGGLLEGTPAGWERVQLDGSAKRALNINPGFNRYVFIEKDQKRLAALRRLHSPRAAPIDVLAGDANAALVDFFTRPPWSQQPAGRGRHRAVVFLDPYSMAVRWETLRVLATTGAVDVWYLFPLGAVLRQLARNFDAIDAGKRAALDEIFGSKTWRDDLYRTHYQASLFGDGDIAVTRRSADRGQVEAFAQQRLRDLFPYVSKPLPLLTTRGAQLFSLFCLSASPSSAAHSLIAKGVDHVLRKYG